MDEHNPIRERRTQRRREEEAQREASRKRLRLRVFQGIGLLVCLALIAFVVSKVTSGDDEKSPAKGKANTAGKNVKSKGAQNANKAKSTVPTVAHFQGPVPILMYHALDPAPAGTPYPELFVPPKEFENELRFLKKHGFNGVTLAQVFAAWYHDKSLPENPIVLSFDDGIRSQYTVARPLLRHYGWPGVLNLKVLSVDQGELDAEAVREMIDTGWEVDSHTINHLDVSTLSGAELQHEVGDSRKILQKRFKIPVDFFCYPAGQYDDEAIAAVKAAGYEGATTVDPGLATKDEPFTLKRIRVDGGAGAAGLKQSLVDAGVKAAGA